MLLKFASAIKRAHPFQMYVEDEDHATQAMMQFVKCKVTCLTTKVTRSWDWFVST